MKNLIAWIMVIVFIFIGNSDNKETVNKIHDGDFIIHSDVKFNDTKEDVMKKEKLSLEIDSEEYKFIVFNGEVAGYSDTSIWYHFDDNTRICRARYNFSPQYKFSAREKEEVYSDILDLLKEKYGEPINTDDYDYTYIDEEMNRTFEMTKKDYTNYQIKGWLLKYNNYYVEIVYRKEALRNNIICLIDYCYHTNEEIEKTKKEIEERKKEAINDL